VRWEAWKDKEKIHIQSCDKSRARWQKILIDTTKGKEKVHIWGLCGTQEILIDSTKGSEKIRFNDKAGSTIMMDGVTGNIIIRSANKVLINP